jgi:alkane 1-monooxygenase
MKGYTATLANGDTVEYVDRKRWLWLASVLYPLVPVIGIVLHWKSGGEGWLFLPIALYYGLTPLLDWLIGEDRNNPPDAILDQLEKDRYYRRLTSATVPLHYVTLIIYAAYAATQPLSIGAFIGLAAVAGLTGGLAINTGHELGHQGTATERLLAKIVLAVPAYGHFTIAHNNAHHRNVATPEDPASARMGESLYRFARREIAGACREAWMIEKARLARLQKSAWHPQNQILQSYAMTVALSMALVVAFGWVMIPFLLIHNLMAYWQLTSTNYVEHYGLLRSADENNRYERCQPHHSWNSNHILSNLLLFHLERHSDHHAHPQRRYQALKHYDNLPTLPTGYFGTFLMAYVPPLWFRVMDKRLLALANINGDLDKVNIEPSARAALFLLHGRDKLSAPTLTR